MNRFAGNVVIAMVFAVPAFAQTGGTYDLSWNSIDSGGGTSTGGTFQLHGAAGQVDAGDMSGGTFDLQGGYIQPTTPTVNTCTTAADCADLDGGGVTDDVCTWWECNAGTCSGIAKSEPSDMGGAFGACSLDTFCNLADALHALTCFSGNNACDTINIDAGGAFGSCVPDGFCNLADALHALTCFSGDNTCACGPSPESPAEPNVVGQTSLSAVADGGNVEPGAIVQVRIFMNESLSNFRAYQLQAAVSGGRAGSLDLLNIMIESREDSAFAGSADTFDAINIDNGQMLAGLFTDNVATKPMRYLATFVYRASKDATGTFVVDILHDDANRDQTLLVGAEQTDKIAVTGTTPAVIQVQARNGWSGR